AGVTVGPIVGDGDACKHRGGARALMVDAAAVVRRRVAADRAVVDRKRAALVVDCPAVVVGKVAGESTADQQHGGTVDAREPAAPRGRLVVRYAAPGQRQGGAVNERPATRDALAPGDRQAGNTDCGPAGDVEDTEGPLGGVARDGHQFRAGADDLDVAA